jgi:YVTN family beta-propeller protein
MKSRLCIAIVIVIGGMACVRNSQAAQVPYGANAPDIPITSADRVYHADQSSNTVSVYDPSNNSLLGVIPLGDQPQSTGHPPWVNGQWTPANPKPALLWPAAGARNGILVRSQNAGCGFDRLELRNLH